MSLVDLVRMLLSGTKSAKAMALLLLHLAWTKRLFDRAFFAALCVFVGVSRKLASPEPPPHCYVHEVLNASYRALSSPDPKAFVADMGRVIDYLYQRGKLSFVGYGWHWEATHTTRCPTYLSRLFEQGYLRFDPARKAFRHEQLYSRYLLEL